jgi:hypothetical protein
MTDDELNPMIFGSALEEDGTLDRSKWNGAHKWNEGECAECGTTRDIKTFSVSSEKARKEIIKNAYDIDEAITWAQNHCDLSQEPWKVKETLGKLHSTLAFP